MYEFQRRRLLSKYYRLQLSSIRMQDYAAACCLRAREYPAGKERRRGEEAGTKTFRCLCTSTLLTTTCDHVRHHLPQRYLSVSGLRKRRYTLTKLLRRHARRHQRISTNARVYEAVINVSYNEYHRLQAMRLREA